MKIVEWVQKVVKNNPKMKHSISFSISANKRIFSGSNLNC